MDRKTWIIAVGCVLCLLTVSCTGHLPSRIKPIEEPLGKGWTCYAAPDAFKKAGIVVEATSDGKYLFDSDFSARAIEATSAIGTATVNSTTTLGGVLQLLKTFLVFNRDAKIEADLTRKVVIKAAYGGTKKQVISGNDVQDIANVYSSRKLTPTSHYFVFRESHSATSVDILVDRSVVGSLGATAILDGLVDVSPKISRDAANNYRLKDKYDKPVGICTLATELVIERGFGGQTTVRPGEEYPVPDNIIIERKGPSVGTSPDPADPLSSYLERSEISPKLFWQLKKWEALPAWLLSAEKLHDNWVESFHRNSINETWPEPLRSAVARTISGRVKFLAGSTTGHKPTLMFSNRTPVFLREIQDIVDYPLVCPNADPMLRDWERAASRGCPDSPPDAKLLVHPGMKQEAARRLALMLGMLEETSYLDGSDTEWNGGVRFGSHFIYYHEVGHIAFSVPNAWPPIEIRPEEEEFAEEIRADQIAMAMLATELRNQTPEVIFWGFRGISLAMSFMAAEEFVKPYKDGLRQIKGPVYRMARLRDWTRLNVEDGKLPPSALTGLQDYWDLFTELLRKVKLVPSPVFSLLRQTADRPQEDWIKARNEIVKWCAFGDRKSVIEAVTNVYRSALEHASSEPGARGVIRVVDFLQKQTASLEPELGLSEALRVSSATLP